ncbi:AMP-binding protein [Nocardioides sp. SOB77]|uniref:AMP-binding protein n=1 Tax=Nocardioides oceani TaxID=3058369 RepID=A0ABT8FBX0_9ACTN|nr:AMP-binding protein [Nocardioides oceani]MDN4172189.1 AMP-binding protein [Nocardioides oceani]
MGAGTFADIVASRAGDDAVGLRFEDRQWTWAEVVAESATRAAALTALVPPPEGRQVHVGVLLENVPDFVFWIGGGALAGAVVVGINASRSGAELAHDIRHADVDLLVTEARLAHLLEGGDHGVPAARVLDVDHPSYDEVLAPYRGAPVPERLPQPDDLAMLLFSSGSTGAPKAVVVSQGRLGRLTASLVGRARLRRDSVTYLCMPLFHGNAVMLNLAPAMHVGATVALTRRFSASAFAEDVHRYGVTFVNYVGRALSYVLSRPEGPRDRTSTLELAYGTEASEADAARFSERFGCEVMEGFGSSEGVFRINRTPETPTGALGLAVDVDVRVLDEATGVECPRAVFDEVGRLLNPEAVGEIVAIGGAERFEGYYRNPEAMADRVRGGDFWSGDLGYRDEQGWFWFAGRSSDWLRVDSENFAAAPVERLLARVPGVLSAVVYAVPDPATGDQVMCTLELEPGASFDPAAFGAHLAAQPEMGAKWWPRLVRVTEAIPLTASNKVDKAPLRAAAWATEDPVHVRVGRTAEYVALDAERRAALEAEFAAHDRQALLPAQPTGR